MEDVLARKNRAIAQPFVFKPGPGTSAIYTSKVDNADYINPTTKKDYPI